MKKKTVLLSATAVMIFLIALYLIGTGFLTRNDVVLLDYYVSRDGTEMTLHTGVMSSAGYTRGFKDTGGGVKPHYLIFIRHSGDLTAHGVQKTSIFWNWTATTAKYTSAVRTADMRLF